MEVEIGCIQVGTNLVKPEGLFRKDLTISERVQLGLEIEAELHAQKAVRSALKSKWITNARAQFSPGARQPCYVCGRYTVITHAHHVAPLALQFDLGLLAAAHEFEWLCPTHHALVHACFSDQPRSYATRPADGVPLYELDACEALMKRGADLLVKSAVAERGV